MKVSRVVGFVAAVTAGFAVYLLHVNLVLSIILGAVAGVAADRIADLAFSQTRFKP